ncbi:uncharacterized protein C24H6.02c isoform X2 [Asparagus officinalis]|uniref:uncharacterized protein C24H6.02c isoform X2 n=1 Tax=Asparagus officinalis TaxID=4686 RepID=UPI00098E714F|nr:uncharacterized protein C24H6.02c isoform X2 [Asparagus officinalis]
MSEREREREMALAANNVHGFFSPSFFCANPPKQTRITSPFPSISLPVPSKPPSFCRGKPRIISCSNGKNFGGDSSSSKESSFDLKLPRRSLLVQFTCNACGERTERTINRVAYERGTVFVQCAGCLANHKLVDNLGLVVEYDLRKEMDADINGTHQA